MFIMSSKDNTKLTKEEREAAAAKVREVSERLFKLVVKIIRWETELPNSNLGKPKDKITPEEWKTYEKHILKISTSEREGRVREKLDETYKAIKSHRGFA